MCFSGGLMAIFCSVYFSGLGFALRKFTRFSVSWPWSILLCEPVLGLTDIIQLKKKKRCLNLFHWNFAAACFISLCCHVIWGSVWDTVQCIKMSETCNFPEGNGKSVDDRNILLFAKCISIWSPNLLFGFPKYIFSESDAWSLIFFKYF